MAHDVKTTEIVKKFVEEVTQAFYAEMFYKLELLREKIVQMQIEERAIVTTGSIDTVDLNPKKSTGFLIEVAVVGGVLDHFIEFRESLGGNAITSSNYHFVCKGYKFTFISELHDNYCEFEKVICIATYFDTTLLEIIDRIVGDKEECSVMTPMELLHLFNQPQ